MQHIIANKRKLSETAESERKQKIEWVVSLQAINFYIRQMAGNIPGKCPWHINTL